MLDERGASVRRTTGRRNTTGPDGSDGAAIASAPVRMGRALTVGVVGACLNAYLLQYVGLYMLGSNLGVDYLPIGVLCLFVPLILLNPVLRRFGVALRRGELVVAYVTMLVTGAIGGSGLAARLIPSMVAVFYFATPENDWESTFHGYMPDWIAPQDADVIHMFYHGTEGAPIPWGDWLLPLATWLVPWIGMVCLTLGLGMVLRERWLKGERLTFPLVQVPLALLGNDETPGFNRELRKDVVFWGAFAIPVVLRALQGLHHHFPSVPMVPIGDLGNVGLMFQDPVWADLFNTTSLQIHLALVGIAILMRSEVSASFWVFEWFYLGVGAFLYSMGPGEGAFAYTPQATFGYVMFIYYCRLGGTLVAATLLLWTARPYITRGWRLLIRGVSERRDGDGLLMWSVPLIVVGIAMYLGWAHAGGMTMGAALLMLIVYVASLVVLARIIADGGLFWASLSLDPMRTTVRFLGTEAMSGETLTMVAFTNHVPMAPRSNILPSIMDSFQFGNKTGVSPNKIVAGMAVGILSVGIFSLATLLWLSYSHGATNLDVGVILSSATFPFAEAGTYMRNAASVNVASIWTTVLGGVLMSIFIFLHRRLLWWPVYPFGFAIAESATMEHMWLSVFIGWFVHVIVVRIWGTAGYRRIKPAAIGVVVGDFLSLGLWAVIDIMTGTIGNRLSHGVSTW